MIFQLFEEPFIKESIPEFVRIVYLLLESSPTQHIMSWVMNGEALQIHNPQILQSEILPVLFKQKTLNSFIRQLNIYNFKKYEKGNVQKMIFYHEYFKRNNLQNLSLVKRKHRGYIDHEKLKYQQISDFNDRFDCFEKGILNKIKNNLEEIKQKTPEIYFSLSEMISNIKQKKNGRSFDSTTTIDLMPSISAIKYQQPDCKPEYQQTIKIPTSAPIPEVYCFPIFTSITCFMNDDFRIPYMLSLVSLPQQN